MPNICDNHIVIHTDSDSMIDAILEKCVVEVKDDQKWFFNDDTVEIFDITQLLPEPKEFDLIHTGSAVDDNTGERVNNWYEVDKESGEKQEQSLSVITGDKTKTVGVPQEVQDELLEKYGAVNGYDWRNKFWGTKWITGSDMDYVRVHRDNQMIAFENTSAWCPPYALFENVAVLLKGKVWFVCQWSEESGDFGNMKINSNFNGDLITDYDDHIQ